MQEHDMSKEQRLIEEAISERSRDELVRAARNILDLLDKRDEVGNIVPYDSGLGDYAFDDAVTYKIRQAVADLTYYEKGAVEKRKRQEEEAKLQQIERLKQRKAEDLGAIGDIKGSEKYAKFKKLALKTKIQCAAIPVIKRIITTTPANVEVLLPNGLIYRTRISKLNDNAIDELIVFASDILNTASDLNKSYQKLFATLNELAGIGIVIAFVKSNRDDDLDYLNNFALNHEYTLSPSMSAEGIDPDHLKMNDYYSNSLSKCIDLNFGAFTVTTTGRIKSTRDREFTVNQVEEIIEMFLLVNRAADSFGFSGLRTDPSGIRPIGDDFIEFGLEILQMTSGGYYESTKIEGLNSADFKGVNDFIRVIREKTNLASAN